MTGNTATSDFVSVFMPFCKFNGASKDDPANQGLTMTMPFQSLEDASASGATFEYEDSSLWIQDSQFA
jgi:hypothetical protein